MKKVLGIVAVLAFVLSASPVMANDAANPCAANPCAANPCAAKHDSDHKGHMDGDHKGHTDGDHKGHTKGDHHDGHAK